MRYPRNRQMHNTGGRTQIFTFKSEKEYEDKLKAGWCFNPADVSDRKKGEEKKEVAAEEVKKEEIKIHDMETPSEPLLKIDETTEALSCDICGSKFKNTTSLRMHKLHGHKVK